MSAVADRRSTMAPPRAWLVDSARGQLPSTLEQNSISFGTNRTLPSTHLKSWDYAMCNLAERLYMYRGLEEDWDGYGGQAATFGSFTNAMEFVKKITRRFDVPASMLAGDGEISLFWRKNGSYLEVSFPGDNSCHFIYKADGEVYASQDISLDTHQLDPKLFDYLVRI